MGLLGDDINTINEIYLGYFDYKPFEHIIIDVGILCFSFSMVILGILNYPQYFGYNFLFLLPGAYVHFRKEIRFISHEFYAWLRQGLSPVATLGVFFRTINPKHTYADKIPLLGHLHTVALASLSAMAIALIILSVVRQ